MIIGPPRLMDPVCFPGTIVPSGTSQTCLPVNRSTASVVPHGGALQGTLLGRQEEGAIEPVGSALLIPEFAIDTVILVLMLLSVQLGRAESASPRQ